MKHERGWQTEIAGVAIPAVVASSLLAAVVRTKVLALHYIAEKMEAGEMQADSNFYFYVENLDETEVPTLDKINLADLKIQEP